MKKISSKSIACVQAIGNRESFETHGALRAAHSGTGASFSIWDSGRLSGKDLEQWKADLPEITYVVFSYATPIAWVADDRVYKVTQKFSPTTSQHQGRLYLLN